MKYYIKSFIVSLIRIFLRIGYIFPVQRNKILFSSYEGMQYTCNPKYIFQGLFESLGSDHKYVWVLNNPENLPEQYRGKVKTVTYLSPKHIYHLLTSGFIINNLGIEPILPKRKSQTFINTWHGGGAYKVVSYDMNMFSKSEKLYIRHMRDIRKKGTDFFLSSCRKFTEISSRDFDIDESRFVQSGLPRNDRFFQRDKRATTALRKLLAQKNDFPEDNLLVLYAPTYRGTHRKQALIDNEVCSQSVAQALYNKFGKPVTFLFRSHISKGKMVLSHSDDINVIDMTIYPDMQELLEVADVLITDYSSSIWDFCITRKPAFLYTPDLDQYLADRGFYTPIDNWPYDYAMSISDLCKIINNYKPENNLEKIKKHQEELGSYENGKAILHVQSLLKIK